MSIWKKPVTLEDMTESRRNTMVEYVGIEFTEIGDTFLKGRMQVNEKTKQPFGIMHGGASCVLAETLGSIAANYCIEEGKVAVGLSIYTNHIRMIKEGYVTGVAQPLQLGRTVQVWDIKITDENEKLISSTRLTLSVIDKFTASENG